MRLPHSTWTPENDTFAVRINSIIELVDAVIADDTRQVSKASEDAYNTITLGSVKRTGSLSNRIITAALALSEDAAVSKHKAVHEAGEGNISNRNERRNRVCARAAKVESGLGKKGLTAGLKVIEKAALLGPHKELRIDYPTLLTCSHSNAVAITRAPQSTDLGKSLLLCMRSRASDYELDKITALNYNKKSQRFSACFQVPHETVARPFPEMEVLLLGDGEPLLIDYFGS